MWRKKAAIFFLSSSLVLPSHGEHSHSYSYSDISSPPHHTSHASDYGLELGLYDCTPSFVLVLVQIVLRTAATQAPGPWLNEASSVSGYPQDLHFRSVSAAQFTGSLRPSPTLREFACPALHPMHGCSTSTPSIKLSETKIEFQDKHPQGYQATTTTTPSGLWWRLFGPIPFNITRNHSLNTYPSI